jgi:hypothetical protein
MKRSSASAVIAAIAILMSPVSSFAQGAGGSSTGSGSTTGAPGGGSVGAGTSGIGGAPSGPASPGGLNNAAGNPSGAGSPSGLGAPPPGTNSAGTAQSSGITTGAAMSQPHGDVDAAISEENRTIDRKLKGICRGC